MINNTRELQLISKKLIDLGREFNKLTQLQENGEEIKTFDSTMGIYRTKLANPKIAEEKIKGLIKPLTESQLRELFDILRTSLDKSNEQFNKGNINQFEAETFKNACNCASGFVYANFHRDDVSSK